MSRQIVKQPNGLYAVWSTIVDDFVCVNATRRDIVDDLVATERGRIEQSVKSVCNELDAGGKPYCQFTHTFEELVDYTRDVHGGDTDAIKILDNLRQLKGAS